LISEQGTGTQLSMCSAPIIWPPHVGRDQTCGLRVRARMLNELSF
jgi:hypothetical protein